MTLREQIETDATTVFTRTDDFAETVTYFPKNYPGETVRASRSISAVVFRQTVTQYAEDGSQSVVKVFTVHVANDATTGITTDELDRGGDQIQFAPLDGRTAEKRSITHLIESDNGMLVLQCQ